MVDGASDEDSVGKLSDLDGGEGFGVAGVANEPVEGEEILDTGRYIGMGENGVEGDVGSGGSDKLDSGIVAENTNMAVMAGGETTGEGREVGESNGEGVLE